MNNYFRQNILSVNLIKFLYQITIWEQWRMWDAWYIEMITFQDKVLKLFQIIEERAF